MSSNLDRSLRRHEPAWPHGPIQHAEAWAERRSQRPAGPMRRSLPFQRRVRPLHVRTVTRVVCGSGEPQQLHGPSITGPAMQIWSVWKIYNSIVCFVLDVQMCFHLRLFHFIHPRPVWFVSSNVFLPLVGLRDVSVCRIVLYLLLSLET